MDDYEAYRAGSLDYYVGLPLPDLARDEGKLRRHLAGHPRVVLLTTGRFWDGWTNRPASLQKVFYQHVDWSIWILATQDGPAPAPKITDAGLLMWQPPHSLAIREFHSVPILHE